MVAIIFSAALAFGVPPWMLCEVARIESGFRVHAVNVNRNGSVDRGLFQLNNVAHPHVNPWNPRESARYAARYLRDLRRETGSWRHALTAYNVGIGRWKRGYRPGRYAALVLSQDPARR
jgi:soluble lytic murein transglycosylase-like protein